MKDVTISGIWGSAFCILFKRLLEDNRNKDPVEMIRQEMGTAVSRTVKLPRDAH